MKGGYQILDLTGATAGSPVEVKGIYKAAAGNNGKPVMILTNDGQRVYAEIAEDDGDFITCYISAEGKTVNITIKSDDSVTTMISDLGASITGLEQAVNELNGNKAAKSDITDLECTGTKNTTGNTIAAGRYFYLNGALCKATADIANGATFTFNTNFAVVTIDEELSALNSNLNYQRVVGDVTGTKLLDWIVENCTETGVYAFTIGDTSSFTDVPANFSGYSTGVACVRDSIIKIYICGHNSYNIYFNGYNDFHWAGWLNLTQWILPTEKTAITGSNQNYTIVQNQQYTQSYYYQRYGMLFVEIAIKCVTKQTTNQSVCNLPKASEFTTIHTILADSDSGEIMPAVFQNGQFYVKNGTAGKTYIGCFSYPIS